MTLFDPSLDMTSRKIGGRRFGKKIEDELITVTFQKQGRDARYTFDCLKP